MRHIQDQNNVSHTNKHTHTQHNTTHICTANRRSAYIRIHVNVVDSKISTKLIILTIG